jgi:hypothetical protein
MAPDGQLLATAIRSSTEALSGLIRFSLLRTRQPWPPPIVVVIASETTVYLEEIIPSDSEVGWVGGKSEFRNSKSEMGGWVEIPNS